MMEIKVKKSLYTTDGLVDLDIDLSIEEGSIVAITGKSGSGKTTFLRIISGLMAPDEGEISMSNSVWLDTNRKINVRTQKRNAGFVFQDYALFPNMTVRKNILYALNDAVLADELLSLVGLEGFGGSKPEYLSGGQKQRVALARALASIMKASGKSPGILLLDEPLSAVDNGMRAGLQEEILRIHSKFGMTILLVSHDASEIFKLADRLVVLDSGKITRDGKPDNIFLDRQTSHKFSFTGILLDMKKADIIYIAHIGIGNNICEVVLSSDDAGGLSPGDRVLIASKAFNPIIKKITDI